MARKGWDTPGAREPLTGEREDRSDPRGRDAARRGVFGPAVEGRWIGVAVALAAVIVVAIALALLL